MAWTFLRVYFDQEKAWETLSDAERGRLLLAALKYAAREEPPTFSGNERYQWPQIQVQIDKERLSYQQKVSQCSEAGKASAASRGYYQRSSTTVNDRQRSFIKEQEQEQEQRNGGRRKAVAFRPPTLEEVEAYCRERGSGMDPQRFIDYYTSNGWKVGRNSMKDWKAAVRTWEQKDAASGAEAKPKGRNAPTEPAATLSDQIKKYGNPADKLAAVQALFGARQEESGSCTT